MPGLELPIVSFISLVLVLFPLPWHWRARNIPVLALIAWLSAMNLIQGVNTILWHRNYEVRSEVWCDISTKIFVGFSIAMPSATMCICRDLYAMTSIQKIPRTVSNTQKKTTLNIAMCFGFPIFIMVLHYTVQGHRFDIYENFGCYPATYISWPALVIIWIPPLVLFFVWLGYTVLSLRWFISRRKQFGNAWINENLSISTYLYMRLMGVAVSLVFWNTAVSAYLLYVIIHNLGLRPWTSWANVHSNFSHIMRFPSNLSVPWVLILRALTWWVPPSSAIIFILFFGFGKEPVREYRKSIDWICQHSFRCKYLSPRHSRNAPSSTHPVPIELNDNSKSPCNLNHGHTSSSDPHESSPALSNSKDTVMEASAGPSRPPSTYAPSSRTSFAGTVCLDWDLDLEANILLTPRETAQPTKGDRRPPKRPAV